MTKTMTERVKIDRTEHRITYTLMDHPTYIGYVRHELARTEGNGADHARLTLTIDLISKDGDDTTTDEEVLPVLIAAAEAIRAEASGGSGGRA